MSNIRSFTEKTEWIQIAAFAFIMITAMLCTYPIGEGDFFWHVKTGQWIWEHKALPTSDPFSHITSYLANTEHTVQRTAFILKQYWIGQLALFGVWSIAGDAGMVALRAIIYTCILAGIYRWISVAKNGLIALISIFFIGNEFIFFSNERPQIFAYIFFVLLLWLLEKIYTRSNRQIYYAIAMTLLMLVWGNTHGSFILGIIIICIHLFSGILYSIKSKDLLSNITYPIALITAIFASGVNPNGFNAFRIAMDMNKRYVAAIGEYTSPLTLATKFYVIDYYYWLPIFVTAFFLLFKFKSIPLRHHLTIITIALLSLTAQRYVPFFILATPLLAINLPAYTLKKKYTLLPLAIIIIWMVSQQYDSIFKFKASREFPKGAVEFLNTTKPAGELFNPYLWGGYLMLHTNYKVFVDGRGLAENFTELQQDVLDGFNWQGVLSYFKINTIITPGTDLIRNLPYRLMWDLRNSNDWVLVYQDETALIFVKNIPENLFIIKKYALGKEHITKHIISRRDWQFRGDN